MLVLTAGLPQVFLLTLNLWTFWLVSGDASRKNLDLLGMILSAEAGLLMIIAGAWYFARKQKTYIHWTWFSVLFLGQIGFLWFFVTHLGHLIPPDVDRWIVGETMLCYYAFALMMPGLFYTGMQLACFELSISQGKDFWLTFLFAILSPALFYFLFLSLRMFSNGNAFFYMLLWPLFFIGLTVLMFVGLIRLIVLIYNRISDHGDQGQMLFALLVGLVGPIGGLILNRDIPFPANFQSSSIYILAVINGFIVLLPRMNKFDGGTLFLRSLTYPFTLYFFLVFLPFSPLALPAIFALGFGFLFLVPIFLFIFHTKKVADDFKECVSRSGMKMAMFLIVSGVSLLPGYFVFQTYADKIAIKEVLRYVYSPNYAIDQIFKGDVQSTRRVLLNLKIFKDGNQLPYLSDFYNGVVFEGMVLPDKKIGDMYRIFTGEAIEEAANSVNWRSGRDRGFGLTRGRTSGRRLGRMRQVDHNVGLDSFQVQVTDEGYCRRSRLQLVMRNTGFSTEAEFRTNISVPSGVIITGFQLRIGQDMVPGQIFERRTAEWVYHMIRDFVRRDPGILFYKTIEQVNLSVYPFTQGETREVEITFEFPANFKPIVRVGDQTISLTESSTFALRDTLSASDSEGNTFLFIPKEQSLFLPEFKRKPYLHFILDRSQKGLENLSGYREQIESVAARYPQMKMCRITAANFSTEEVSGVIDVHQGDALRIALQKIGLKRQGGFNVERVIQAELYHYAGQIQKASAETGWQTYPIFVVISPDEVNVDEMKGVEVYQDIIPEAGYYLTVSCRGDVKQRSLWGEPANSDSSGVVALRYGQQVSFISPKGDQFTSFSDPEAGRSDVDNFSVFDISKNQFIPLGAVKEFSASGEFINKLSLLKANKKALLNPATLEMSLSNLVKESRRLGILIPSTSFIVVERSIQRKALQINEKKRLRTANAFEFEEEFKTPAPSFWLLVIVISILLTVKEVWQMLSHNKVKAC